MSISYREIKQLLFGFPIFFIAMTALFSPIMIYQYINILSVLTLFLLICFILVSKKEFTVSAWWSVFLFGYLMIIPYVMGNGFIANRYSVFALLIFGNVLCEYCEYSDKWHCIKKVLYMLFPFLLFVYVKTFLALRHNSYASRMIKTYDAYTVRMRGQGVGGYEFIYFLALIASICVALFFLLRKRRQKAICLVLGVMAYVEIVISNYMTALLIATVGIGATLTLLLIRRNKAWLIFFIMSLLMIVLVGNELMRALIEMALKFLPAGGKTYMRLFSMKDAFFQGIFNEFLTDRNDIMLISVRCFWDHPFLGIIVEDGITSEELLSNVGQHSCILDTFAFYGGFVGVGFLYNIYSIFKKKFFQDELIVITLPLLISESLLLLFNNITMATGVVVGIIYPFTLHLLNEQKRH